MCYGDPSATEVPPCCETATKKFTFSTTSVLLLLNMPLSLSRATIFRRQKNPRRVYRPKIAGILFVCNEPEGKYYTVPVSTCQQPKDLSAGREGIPVACLDGSPAHAQCVNYVMEIFKSFWRGRLVLTRRAVARSDVSPRYVWFSIPENAVRWYGDFPVRTYGLRLDQVYVRSLLSGQHSIAGSPCSSRQ